MQHDAQERRLDLDASVVVDVPHLPKFVHKEIDASSRRADDFGERLLRQSWDHPLWSAILGSVPRQEQKGARQPLLNRVEEMVDEILFDADIPLEHVSEELLIQFGMPMQHLEHVLLFNDDDGARVHRHRSGDVSLLTSET